MSRSGTPPGDDTAGALPADRCPLCGGGNACAMAAGGGGAPCWCVGAVFDAALLATVPPAARGRACICAACAGAAATRAAQSS